MRPPAGMSSLGKGCVCTCMHAHVWKHAHPHTILQSLSGMLVKPFPHFDLKYGVNLPFVSWRT